jgi:hypothetical protein
MSDVRFIDRYKLAESVKSRMAFCDDKVCYCDQQGDNDAKNAWHGYLNCLKWILCLIERMVKDENVIEPNKCLCDIRYIKHHTEGGRYLGEIVINRACVFHGNLR